MDSRISVFPKDECEFNHLMEEIDNDLKRRGILIFQRPIYIPLEIMKRFGISIPLVPNSPYIPGDYGGDSLSSHIIDWYQKRYGDRLNIDFSPGSVALLIKGDPYRLKLPWVYGHIKLNFDPNLDKDKNAPLRAPFRSVEGLTSEQAKSLSRRELKQFAAFFIFALQTVQGLACITDKNFIPEAQSDLETAVSNLFMTRPHYGQSKWATLQFTEKLFKCYLSIQEQRIPKSRVGHDLIYLSRLASKEGLQVIPNTLLNFIQCDPSVRYGATIVDMNEAIKAHHASLEVCFIAVSTIQAMILSDLSIQPPETDTLEHPSEGHFYVLPSLNYYYYCENIKDDRIYWILLESYQHGHFIQVKFIQERKYASKYVRVTNVRKLASLYRQLLLFQGKTYPPS
jgi:hypothetical protein